MADMTFDLMAKIAPTETLRTLIYSALERDRWIGGIPMTPWGAGGQSKTYKQIKTLPTADWAASADSYTASTQDYDDLEVFLKILYVEGALENLPNATMNEVLNQRDSYIRGMFLSFGNEYRDGNLNGASVTEAVGATAVTKGIDGFVPGPRLRADLALLSVTGLVVLDFDDTADTIRAQFPGETGYGATVSTAANLTSVPIYGQNPTNWAYLTMDVSDSEGGGDWTTTDAATGVVLTTSKKIDGLGTLVNPLYNYWGNIQATGPSTNGDALSIDALRWLIQQVSVLGPKSQMAIIMNPRTYRSSADLIDTNARISEFMGVALAEDTFGFDGVPIFTSPSVGTAETVGSTTDATSVYCAFFDRAQGYHVYFARATEVRTLAETAADVRGAITPMDTEQAYQIPVAFRSLGERQAGAPAEMLRLDMYLAGALMNQQAAARIRGITD